MSSESLKGMFNIDSPKMFFELISTSLDKYEERKHKDIEHLFFILLGLNHLREWIAPGYDHNNKPSSPREHFYQKIFKMNKYKVVNELCNGSKHLKYNKYKNIDHEIDYKSNPTMSAWDPLNDVQNLRDGTVDNYSVDGEEVGPILREVLNFYKKECFDKKLKLDDINIGHHVRINRPGSEYHCMEGKILSIYSELVPDQLNIHLLLEDGSIVCGFLPEELSP